MAENIAVLSPGLADIPLACAVTASMLGISGDHKEFRAGIEALGQRIADAEGACHDFRVSHGWGMWLIYHSESRPGKRTTSVFSTRKPAHCQVHHVKPWVDGGKTKLNNLTLLCLYHHRMIRRRLAHPYGQTSTRIHWTTMGQLQQSPQTKPATG